ncbi:citrate synthase [Sulfuracidifex tepidarius]|nr:citrate synthase [Sulfuracidifex tepidarius]
MMQVSRGLEDVIIKTTSLTFIDGEKGILRYRGYDINDLMNASYEEVIYLMLYGDLPSRGELEEVKSIINESYDVPESVINVIFSLGRSCDPIGMMETAFGALASVYNPAWDKERDKETALKIIAKASTVTCNVMRAKEGLKPKVPEPSESYAKSFLRSSLDKEPDELEVKAMDNSLVLYTDHEVPASTTAGLVTASTLSDMYSCVTAALAALKGPLHGGAAEGAFNQFVDIGSPEKVEEWFSRKMEEKKRIMGFGHRVYKTYDPRAKIFKRLAESLSSRKPEAKTYFEIASKLDEVGEKHLSEKKLFPNTDFYSGILFYSMGFPVYMFTPIFALSRTLGWTSHFIEYVEEQHRLIRPRAAYVGAEKREFVPLEKRS